MQQTIRSRSARKEEKSARRRDPGQRERHGLSLEPVIAVAFLGAYLWLASQMEGINFDTGFIALFCAFLSVFVVRCFHAAISGRMNY